MYLFISELRYTPRSRTRYLLLFRIWLPPSGKEKKTRRWFISGCSFHSRRCSAFYIDSHCSLDSQLRALKGNASLWFPYSRNVRRMMLYIAGSPINCSRNCNYSLARSAFLALYIKLFTWYQLIYIFETRKAIYKW